MRLRSLDSLRTALARHLRKEGLPEQGQGTEAFDAPESRLDVVQPTKYRTPLSG